MIFIKHFISVLILGSLLFCFYYYIFSPILNSDSIIISYGVSPFDICQKNPDLWYYIKILFVCTSFFSSFVTVSFLLRIALIVIKSSFFSKVIHIFYNVFGRVIHIFHSKKEPFLSNFKDSFSDLKLYIGDRISDQTSVFVSEKGLYQNFLITGTIGTGKTSSAMYPFTKQLIAYSFKIPILLLDVKGNYYLKVRDFCQQNNRLDDLIIIELGGKYKYNPLHKPDLKPTVLANRLKSILLLFSPNNSESYWLDKAEQVLAECIKLCRLYNNGYVTFEEIHKLVNQDSYYKEKIHILKDLFIKQLLSKDDIYNLLSSMQFFEQEFFSLDARTLSILKSEITRITNCFVADYDVYQTFCPKYEDLNFYGFDDDFFSGKIVVLNMNISEYKNISKIIATYLKLDFQTAVMSRISNKDDDQIFPVAFFSDEYQEYCTVSDSEFFAQSREAKCINIVATQSYTSLLNCLNNQYAVQVIIQNLINKLWFRTDDIFTIENIQKQIGKEDKEKVSKSISENAKETKYSYFSHSLNSNNSSISESINTYLHSDFIYDTHFFTQELETFSCLAFLSDGNKILDPQKLKLKPYFLN